MSNRTLGSDVPADLHGSFVVLDADAVANAERVVNVTVQA
jgi:hypothetical protein